MSNLDTPWTGGVSKLFDECIEEHANLDTWTAFFKKTFPSDDFLTWPRPLTTPEGGFPPKMGVQVSKFVFFSIHSQKTLDTPLSKRCPKNVQIGQTAFSLDTFVKNRLSKLRGTPCPNSGAPPVQTPGHPCPNSGRLPSSGWCAHRPTSRRGPGGGSAAL